MPASGVASGGAAQMMRAILPLLFAIGVSILGGRMANAQAVRPPLYVGCIGNTARETDICAKTIARLNVAFQVRSGTVDSYPPIAVDLTLFSSGNVTALSIVMLAPRPPISLYRGVTTAICGGNTIECADMIVDGIYKHSGKWYDVPAYAAGP